MKKMLIMLVMAVLAVSAVDAAIFAKYDGIDGESTDKNHDKWIDVQSYDWGMHQPGGGATGQSRRRGAAIVEDMTLNIEYDKASPKIQEALLMGKVIPKLEIEQTATFSDFRTVYLRYELKNVMITSFDISADSDEMPMTVVGSNFEEINPSLTVC